MFLSVKNCVGQTKLSASWIPSVSCQSVIPVQTVCGVILKDPPNHSVIRQWSSRSGKEVSPRDV